MSAELAATAPPRQAGGDFPEFYSRCCTTDLSAAQPTGVPRIDGMKAILTRASGMWENGRASLTLTVGFVNPDPGTPTQQGKVKEVVKKWEAVANLKFQFISNGRNANIRIAFEKDQGSWSTVGKGALRRDRALPTMNFGWVESTPGITDVEQGVILHEFGHAIGYHHEHQSPRRGEKLTLNEAVIIKQMWLTQVPPWDEAETRANILDVFSRQEVSNFSEVDFTSIMMYFMPAEWNTQGIEIEETSDLSPLDKAFAFLNYPFITTPSSDPNVNLVNALNTAGITGTYRQNITSEFGEGDWQGIRAEFTRWAVNSAAAAGQAAAISERESAAAIVPAAPLVAAAA